MLINLRIRLAGLVIRLAGYWPESEKHEFGLPVCIIGWPVSRQICDSTNSACRILKNRKSGYVPERSSLESGYPNVAPRATKANPVFRIENPVIRNLTRKKSIRKKMVFRMSGNGIFASSYTCTTHTILFPVLKID